MLFATFGGDDDSIDVEILHDLLELVDLGEYGNPLDEAALVSQLVG